MSDRLNVLHISDLHYAPETNHNISVVLKAFKESLESLFDSHLRPDLIVFSGDLVKRGDDEDAYNSVFDLVLDWLAGTDCGNSIFLTQGNHDVQRSVVSKDRTLHETLRGLSTRDQINDLAYRSDVVECIENKFANFIRLNRIIESTYKVDEDLYYSSFYIPHIDVAVVSMNTSCYSWGGFEKVEDEGFLAVPEVAIVRATSRLPHAGRKILVTHHPPEFLSTASKSDFVNLIRTNFDIHLFGHLHEPDPTQINSLQGTCFCNQSGALYTDRGRLNGFAVVSLHPHSKHLEVNLRTYFDEPRRRFGIAENLGAGGVFYSSPQAAEFWNDLPKAIPSKEFSGWLTRIVEPAFQKLVNQGFADKPITEVFVEPPVTLSPEPGAEDEPHTPISMQEMLAGGENFVVVGKREFGKTTFLQQLALKSIQTADDARLPCLIDFADVQPGEDRVLRAIKTRLVTDLPRDVTLEKILADGKALIVVDDVDQRKAKQFSALQGFIRQYPKNRFIFSAPSELYDEIVAAATLDLAVPFRYVYLQLFSRSKLRTLVERWGLPTASSPDLVLDRLVKIIVQINIPLTAVSGTILLTILESGQDESPTNRATLVERFLESLLAKWSPEEARRSAYDFRFKTHYLAHLAAEMVRRDSYSLDVGECIEITKAYFENLGIPERPDKWIHQFIEARILSDRGMTISFRYRAFCEYFIALNMTIDEKFKAEILEEESYLSFINEIEYYAAIKRNDSALLSLVGERFASLSDSIFTQLNWRPNIALFQKLRRPKQKSPEKVFAAVARELQLPAITTSERDEILQSEIPSNLGIRQEVYRPVYADDAERWNMCLFLYSRVFRNSELVTGPEKKKHLADILKGWSQFAMIALLAIPILVRHRKIIINGVKYVVRMPRSMPDEEVAEQIYLSVPRSTSRLVALMAGSEKFVEQLAHPAIPNGFEDEPLIVRFFREFLYVDLQLPNFVANLEDFSKALRRSGYLHEAMLSKLRELFYLLPLKPKQDQDLRRLAATIATDLYSKGSGDRQDKIERRVQRYRKRKLVQKLRKSDEAT